MYLRLRLWAGGNWTVVIRKLSKTRSKTWNNRITSFWRMPCKQKKIPGNKTWSKMKRFIWSNDWEKSWVLAPFDPRGSSEYVPLAWAQHKSYKPLKDTCPLYKPPLACFQNISKIFPVFNGSWRILATISSKRKTKNGSLASGSKFRAWFIRHGHEK